MSGVSPRIIWYAFFFGIALILGACVKPVDAWPFLDDERVQDLINGGKPGVIIDFTPPAEIVDLKPVVEWQDTTMWMPISEGASVNISSGSSVTIRAYNSAGTYNTLEWSCNGVTVGTIGTISLRAGDAPFDVADLTQYIVSVVVTFGGVPYSTWFYVTVN